MLQDLMRNFEKILPQDLIGNFEKVFGFMPQDLIENLEKFLLQDLIRNFEKNLIFRWNYPKTFVCILQLLSTMD